MNETATRRGRPPAPEPAVEGAPALIVRAEDREIIADMLAEILIAQLEAEGEAR